ncbi:MAG TPA: hypothetical protein VK466_15110, partial [Terriglobales bacterium]|nr:hypothetical protein [Terriglobales bacterium]
MRKSLFVGFFGLVTLAVVAQDAAQSAKSESPVPRPSSGAYKAMETISADRIRAHVRFLAHDLLEGRGTGARGGDIAAEYIATQLALAGLKPAGDNGTYMQKVPMVGITPGADTTFTFVPESTTPMALKVLDDYVAYDQTQQSQSEIRA